MIQLSYWGLLARGYERSKEKPKGYDGTIRPGITVIVAARNEEANLIDLLTALRNQDYPDFEILVVDDGSTDGSADLIEGVGAADSRIRRLYVEPVEPRKKHAITAGIAAAIHELIALTDADCRPPAGWLTEIAAHHAGAQKERVVIGYGPLDRTPTLINRVARYENMVTSFLTAAACGLGRPYMAVGRNMSYRRTLFDHAGGLSSTMKSLSGDDDLFVQHAVMQCGAEVIHMFTPDSAVPSPAPASWKSWLRQKRRHTSAGIHYQPSVQFHLFAFHVTGLALWLAPFLLGYWGAGMLVVRIAAQHQVLRKAATDFGEGDLLILQPLWELSYALYNLLVAPAGLLFQPSAWRTGDDR